MRRLLAALLLVAVCSPAWAAGPTKCYTSPSVPSDYVTARVVLASTAETVTAPTPTAPRACTRGDKVVAVFYASAVFYWNVGETAAVPAADVTDGTSSALIPASVPVVVELAHGAQVSVLSATASAVLTTEWFCKC